MHLCEQGYKPILGWGLVQGLGNRLPGLVTAFALALLTDRVLLIDDAVGKFYGLFSPAFDCNYTQGRRGLRTPAH